MAIASPTPPTSTDLVDLLHQRGQRATPQRLVILRELRRRGVHATADEIRSAVRDELPGTSTPTIYAALELLVELGLVRRIDAMPGAALYDARTEPHQHTVCRRCGRVDDLDGEVDTAALEQASARVGFQAQAVEVVVAGLCPECTATAMATPRRRSQAATTADRPRQRRTGRDNGGQAATTADGSAAAAPRPELRR